MWSHLLTCKRWQKIAQRTWPLQNHEALLAFRTEQSKRAEPVIGSFYSYFENPLETERAFGVIIDDLR